MTDSDEIQLITNALTVVTEIQDIAARLMRESLPEVAATYLELAKERREVRVQLKQRKVVIVGRKVVPLFKAQSLIVAALGEAATIYDSKLIDPQCSQPFRLTFQKQSFAARELRDRIEKGEIHIADSASIA